jgi:hypothetical protein
MKITIKKQVDVNGYVFSPGTYTVTNQLGKSIVKQINKKKNGTNNRNHKRH